MKDVYTISELSEIFQVSKKRTIRYLKHFNIISIPVESGKKYKIHQYDILSNIDLYNSIQLTIFKKVKKPLYSIRDLCPMFGKTHSSMYRWIIRHKIPNAICGNKIVIFASRVGELNKGKQ